MKIISFIEFDEIIRTENEKLSQKYGDYRVSVSAPALTEKFNSLLTGVVLVEI